GGQPVSKVVRQGGTGLIIRTDDRLCLRHQNREAELDPESAGHYLATIGFRQQYYDIRRTSDEVVFSNLEKTLLLSHPQSNIWIEPETIALLIDAATRREKQTNEINLEGLPDWLHISAGDGRLLLSDQRTARWVLLGSDHLAELERRLKSLEAAAVYPAQPRPPVLAVKIIPVRLQSAFKLVKTLERFAETGEVTSYEDASAAFYLKVGRATEGLELSDSERRVRITAREARKWTSIIRSELASLKAEEIERGQIRTVFAVTGEGRWVMQWGDELFIANESLAEVASGNGALQNGLAAKWTDNYLLLLYPKTGNSVALTEAELSRLGPND
ncbi:MAG TPA: hypothetical protein VJQ56_02810, partial [Blastocatellia bacterium]|nr:hypothetical protein [Blastocatellia bacterium]